MLPFIKPHTLIRFIVQIYENTFSMLVWLFSIITFYDKCLISLWRNNYNVLKLEKIANVVTKNTNLNYMKNIYQE